MEAQFHIESMPSWDEPEILDRLCFWCDSSPDLEEYDNWLDEESLGWCSECQVDRHARCEGIIQLDNSGAGAVCTCPNSKCGMGHDSVTNYYMGYGGSRV